MIENLIEHMVERFLTWKLPADFNPDGGISFKQVSSPAPLRSMHWPVGTNLLTFVQAREMVRHMLEGLPEAAAIHTETLTRERDEARAEVDRLTRLLDLYRDAVRVDVKMEGPRVMGSNLAALKRAWDADRAALKEDKR